MHRNGSITLLYNAYKVAVENLSQARDEFCFNPEAGPKYRAALSRMEFLASAIEEVLNGDIFPLPCGKFLSAQSGIIVVKVYQGVA